MIKDLNWTNLIQSISGHSKAFAFGTSIESSVNVSLIIVLIIYLSAVVDDELIKPFYIRQDNCIFHVLITFSGITTIHFIIFIKRGFFSSGNGFLTEILTVLRLHYLHKLVLKIELNE